MASAAAGAGAVVPSNAPTGAAMAVNEPHTEKIRILDTLKMTIDVLYDTVTWCRGRGEIALTTFQQWLNTKTRVDPETYYDETEGAEYIPSELVRLIMEHPRSYTQEIFELALSVRDLGLQTFRAKRMLILSLINYEKEYKNVRSSVLGTYLKDLLINLFFYLDLSEQKEVAKAQLVQNTSKVNLHANASSQGMVTTFTSFKRISNNLPDEIKDELSAILNDNEEEWKGTYPFQSNIGAGSGVGPTFIVGGDGKITPAAEELRVALRTDLAKDRAASFGSAPAETITLEERKKRIYSISSDDVKKSIYSISSDDVKKMEEKTVEGLCSSVTNGSNVRAAASGASSVPGNSSVPITVGAVTNGAAASGNSSMPITVGAVTNGAAASGASSVTNGSNVGAAASGNSSMSKKGKGGPVKPRAGRTGRTLSAPIGLPGYARLAQLKALGKASGQSDEEDEEDYGYYGNAELPKLPKPSGGYRKKHRKIRHRTTHRTAHRKTHRTAHRKARRSRKMSRKSNRKLSRKSRNHH